LWQAFRDVKFGNFKHSKFVCNYSDFIRSSKMAAAAGRRRTTATASPTSLDHPAGGPRETKWQSPVGVRRQQQASKHRLKRHDRHLTIVSHYAGYFDVATGVRRRGGWGWTGIDGRASRLRLLLIGFEYRQTNMKYLGKIANVIVTQ